MTLEERVQAISWYHSIDLGNGLVTPGHIPQWMHDEIAGGIPEDLSGKSVLDIGAWDGYYSFLAERRGAKEVVAIDSLDLGDPHFVQSLDGFRLAKEVLGSKVEYHILPVERLDKLGGEQFDVVFFFGVYYHLKDPILGFDIVSRHCRELLLVEGDALLHPANMMLYNFADGDSSLAWRLTAPLIVKLLEQRGFKVTERYRRYTAILSFKTECPWPISFPAMRLFLRGER